MNGCRDGRDPGSSYNVAMVRSGWVLLLCATITLAADWPQWRGPSGGVSTATQLPARISPTENVVWKTPLPPGHSTPIFGGDRIFVTAIDNDKLFVISLDRATGKVLWRREVPRPRKQPLHAMNNPASPSPVTDGKNVYAFFTDFGLISYGFDGNERWRLPMGPFNNPFGMGASPVLAGDLLIQNCDAETDSFVTAVNTRTGKQVWRVERPDSTRGFSTPLIWRSPEGVDQVLVPGTGQLAAYSVATGEKLWWVRGLTWQLKPTPVMHDGIIYVLGWAGGSDTGQQEELADFAWLNRSFDANKDGRVSLDEITDKRYKNEIDLDTDGFVNEREWTFYRAKRLSQNSLMAVRLGGRGDMTEKNRLWMYTKSLPNATSPLLYNGVIYLIKDGGVLTGVNPANGEAFKQARLKDAIDEYYASPLGADGRIWTISRNGHLTVVKAGPGLEVLESSNFDEECYASPVAVDDRIYIRTRTALYAFGGTR